MEKSIRIWTSLHHCPWDFVLETQNRKTILLFYPLFGNADTQKNILYFPARVSSICSKIYDNSISRSPVIVAPTMIYFDTEEIRVCECCFSMNI